MAVAEGAQLRERERQQQQQQRQQEQRLAQCHEKQRFGNSSGMSDKFVDSGENDDILAQIAAKRRALLAQESSLDATTQSAGTGSQNDTPNLASQVDPAVELRVDPVDGLRYSLQDFLWEYGDDEGRLRWDSAGIVPAPPLKEHRSAGHSAKTASKMSTGDAERPPMKTRASTNIRSGITGGDKASVSADRAQNNTAAEIKAPERKKTNNSDAKNKNSTASQSESVPVAKRLSRSQLRNKNTKLVKAAKGGRVHSVASLLDQRASFNFREPRNGYTALHQAAWNGYVSGRQILQMWFAICGHSF